MSSKMSLFIPFEKFGILFEEIIQKEIDNPTFLFVKDVEMPLLSSLTTDEITRWVYTILDNKSLVKEFRIVKKPQEEMPDGTFRPEGILCEMNSIYSVIRYIENNLFFHKILDMDTAGQCKLCFNDTDFVVI
jgi:hypothetical protein